MGTFKRLQVVATFFFILLYFTLENKAAASEGMSEKETQTLICSPFLHHSCKWHKDVPKIKIRIIQTCIPLFILSTFQAPPPTLVSRLMKNFAASWKTEPGWEHQNTPPLKCKSYAGAVVSGQLDIYGCTCWLLFCSTSLGKSFFFFILPAPELFCDTNDQIICGTCAVNTANWFSCWIFRQRADLPFK